MTLADVKEFLKVDGTADDANITALLNAAVSHVRGAVNNYDTYYGNDQEFTNLADMVTKIMVLELYDRPLQTHDRPLQTHDSAADYSYTVRSMITQLQYWNGEAT